MLKVEEAPPTVHYYPEYISKAEEASLLENVYKAPKPKWTQLSARRLQNWGGLPHPKGMIPEPIPKWLNGQINRIVSFNLFDDKIPNHVLVNEYLPGQGIMPHVDGPLFHPTIATVTLGSHTLLDFYHTRKDEMKFENGSQAAEAVHSDGYAFSLLLERRSLVIIRDTMYTDYLHGIREVENDRLNEKVINSSYCRSTVSIDDKDILRRDTRVSLTIRHIPKVLNVKLKLFNNR